VRLSPFKNNMRRLREAKGLSQEGLARLMNVSTRTIARYEAGESTPRVGVLVALSVALECQIEEFTKPHQDQR
jgi:transcriptional regulator with XRE-family HTH domain